MATPEVITSPGERMRAEIAVLGSGPGGAITAALLAEGGRDVLLIEEGPSLPQESSPPFSRAEMVSKYRNGGLTVTLGRSKLNYVEGRCVGGGSEINSGLYHRTPAEVLDEWRRDFHVEALTPADLEPHFNACEHDLIVSLLEGSAPAASRKLHEGAAQLGWQSLEVPRWYRGGVRQSMSRTFVPRLLSAGGCLLPETRVLRLRRRSACWDVHAEHAGRRLVIEADTVFVACGAIQTSALLRRSGLGPHAGKQLHMHPTVKVVALFPDEVNAPGLGVPVHQVKEFAPRFSFGCSISTPPHLALALAEHPEALRQLPETWRRMAIYYAMTRGGCGSVRPLPFYRDPLVRYRLNAQDQADLAEALRQLSRCLTSAGATALYPQTSLMTIHLFSSCPMGEDRRRCTADSFGRVHESEGLYIADASLLCGAPGVNPQGTLMALVRRNALHFLERL
jgi:choline dehydrogenase-like flavoprotein